MGKLAFPMAIIPLLKKRIRLLRPLALDIGQQRLLEMVVLLLVASFVAQLFWKRHLMV
jgi:hypothetical protein